MILNLLITYIWFGATIPEDYLIKLSKLEYPNEVIMNPPVDNPNLYLRIQKADYYRIKYLQKGGIYSDFDNTINYTKLMQKISSFDGEMLVADIGGGNWKKFISNGFLYVPANRTGLVKQMIKQNHNKTCDDVTKCFGTTFLYQYRDRITKQVFYDTIVHGFDFGWSEDSNAITKGNRLANPAFRSYKVTKAQIVQRIQNIFYLKYYLISGIIISSIWLGVIVNSSLKDYLSQKEMIVNQ